MTEKCFVRDASSWQTDRRCRCCGKSQSGEEVCSSKKLKGSEVALPFCGKEACLPVIKEKIKKMF